MNLFKSAQSQPETFVQLYDTYVERVYQYLLRRLQNTQEVEDLTSRIWEIVLYKIKTLRAETEEGFCAWLFAIARNELNQYFKNKKKHGTQALPEVLMDESKGPEALLKENVEALELHALLTILPPQQREAVELRYFAELKNKEIAPILEISEKTVASNLSRALHTLHERLKKLQ